MNLEKPSVIDLFCGTGGFALGAALAGYEVEVGIDYDRDLTSSFGRNFPFAELLTLDLTQVAPRDIGDHFRKRRITGVIGGPPCQGFSGIGKRNVGDERNRLIVRFCELVNAIAPKFFVMENVPRMADERYGRLVEEALDALPSHYHVMQNMLLDAQDYGVATRRSRLIWVGLDTKRVDVPASETFLPQGDRVPITVRDAIGDIPEPTADSEETALPYRRINRISEYARTMRLPPPRSLSNSEARARCDGGVVTGNSATRHSHSVIERFEAVEMGSQEPISRYARLRWDGPGPVLRAGTGKDRGSYQAARPIHPEMPRVISVREAARLQGFPDWFEFSRTKWHSHRMIGNSIAPPFASSILRTLGAYSVGDKGTV